jgi:DNA-binding HxlR family transcriptional regulator
MDGPRNCAAARALEIVGDRWTLLVVREALLGDHRFDEMQRRTGAPRDILAARLKKLVAAGVLERRPYQEHPPRYEYHLTESGRDLHAVVTALRQWGDRHAPDDGRPRPAPFAHVCGATDPARLVCPDCGEDVVAGSYVREAAA